MLTRINLLEVPRSAATALIHAGLVPVFLVALAGISSCRDVRVAAVEVFRVDIDPASAMIEINARLRFRATIRDEEGRELVRAITWSSSAPEVLDVSPTGEALARGTGEARVLAVVEGRSATANVTVIPHPVVSVEVVPSSASLLVGDTVAFQTVARSSDGSVLTGRIPTWTTGDPAIATVGVDGHVIGRGAGTTTVTAEVEGIRGQASINVQVPIVLPVAAVSITPASAVVAVGDSLLLRATVTASDGSVLTGRTVTWSSGAPTVATVGTDGRVRALAPGTTVVTAQSEGIIARATITVVPDPVASVQLDPVFPTIFVGDTIRIQATLRASNGTVLTGRSIAWTSNAPQVASVDGSGLVTGNESGSATVTATSEGKLAAATVQVLNKPVATVKITPAQPSILAGDLLALQAGLTAADGSNLTGRFVAWTSSDTAVAVVVSNGSTSQSAWVTGKAAGSTVITALSEGKTDTTTATVTLKPVATVVVTPPSLTLPEGGPSPVTATLRAADGTLLTNRLVTWASLDPSVATVAGSGTYQLDAVITAASCPTGQGSCTTTITAVAEGIQGTVDVVVQKTVASVTITPAADTLFEGDTRAFGALVEAADGTVLTGHPVTWSASPANSLGIAPIGSFGGSANVTAGNCAPGTSACAAVLTAAVGSVGGSAAITIVKKVAQVTITPAADTVAEGGHAAFSAAATASDGTALTDRQAVWAATGAAVSITTSGAFDLNADVTAGACPAGTPGSCQAVLTATIDGVPGAVTLLILSPVAQVAIAPAVDTVFEGGSTTFTATPLTANGDAIPDRIVSWQSGDPAVAVPNPTGPYGQTATVNAAAVCPSGTTCATTITATSEGKQATGDIVVLRPVAAITVAPAVDTLFEGGATDLVATVVTAKPDTLSDRLVTWTTPSGLATVAPSGAYQLSATITAGTCPVGSPSCTVTVTAEVEGKTFDVVIIVRKTVSTVLVQLAAGTLFESASTQVNAQVLAPDGTLLTDRGVSWSTSKGLATADSSATWTALVSGKCLDYSLNPGDPDADEDCEVDIIAEADGVTGQATLTILKPVAQIAIVPAGTTTLSVTGTVFPAQADFTAALRAADNAPITNRGASVQWKAVPGNVVKLSANSGSQVTVTANAAGTAELEASVTENGTKTASTASVIITP